MSTPVASMMATIMTALTPAIALAAPTADDIRDIRGPIELPTPTPWWPFALAGVVIVAAVMIVRAIIRRRSKPLMPHEIALQELEAAGDHIQLGDPHRFSSAVSDAIRTYVEHAFALHAPKLTTEELLANLMSDASPVAAHRAELGVFLEHCDLAKYARWSLSRQQMTGMLDSALAFVQATAPSPQGVPA